jgi:hypothetical protein
LCDELLLSCSHKDLAKDAAPHFRKAKKFYDGLAAEMVAHGHICDVFSCALDNVSGLQQLCSVQGCCVGCSHVLAPVLLLAVCSVHYSVQLLACIVRSGGCHHQNRLTVSLFYLQTGLSEQKQVAVVL